MATTPTKAAPPAASLPHTPSSSRNTAAATHLSEATLPPPPPPPMTHSYGAMVDTLYRCFLLNEARDPHGREMALLHKAHVATYRAAGLLDSPAHSLPLSTTAAATVEQSLQRMTLRKDSAPKTVAAAPEDVDTAVFSDSDWSDDDEEEDDPPELRDSHHATSDATSHSKAGLLSAWLHPPAASPPPHAHHDHPHPSPHHSADKDGHPVTGGGNHAALLGSLLLLYVDVFCEQPDAFAPFTQRGHSVNDDAALLYDHLTQKTRIHATAFTSLTRNLRWHSVKSHLVTFFHNELTQRRGSSSPTAATLQPSLTLTPQPSRSRVHSALSSLYHGTSHAPAPGASSTPTAGSTTPTNAPTTLHGDAKQQLLPGPSPEYLRALNVVCSELHALYGAASSAINHELEARVLTPAAFDAFDRAEDVNAAVLDVLRSAALKALIAAYQAAYEKAVLAFPGFVLMSRTMRHRVESDEVFLVPATFTDLIVAVHGVASQLISAFQALVSSHPAAAFDLLTSADALRSLRSAQQHAPISREQETEAVAAWQYDSRVYPKPLTGETFSMLAVTQVGDATVMRELAAERFDEAVERLRSLGQGDKAALLSSLAQQRTVQREAAMTRDIASASRASHLHLSTASFATHDTLDAVPIDVPPNDSDAHPAVRGVAPHLRQKGSEGKGKAEEGSVRLEDIVKWIDISAQYVVGLGRDSPTSELRAIAVYDKTFSEPRYDSLSDLLVSGLTTRDKIHRHQLSKAASHSSTTLADFVEAVLFTSATPSEAVHVGPRFFADPLLVWREGRRPANAAEVRQAVPFDHIDWLQTFVDSPALSGIVHSLTDVTALVDGESDVRKPLSHAVFIPQMDRDGVVVGFELPLHRARTAQPVKVIDLKYPASSYVHSAARATYTNAIKGALSDSPIYGPTQAVNAALERIFDFTDILYLQKQAQALLLLAEAIDGHPLSPFAHSVFTRADLHTGIFYLLRSNIMLSAVFVNLFTANARLTANYLAHIAAKRSSSLAQLHKRGLTVLPLPHSFFALTVLRDATGALTRLKLFVLGFTKLGRSAKPHCAVDFLRPTRETRKRLALQYLLTAANFIYVPFPGVNGAPKMIYKELVVREIHRRQMWEAGLLAHIQHYPGELAAVMGEELRVGEEAAGRLEEQAVLLLQDRKLSPLDFDVVEREQHRDVVETWLEHQDHAYRRVQPKGKTLAPTARGVLLDAEQMLKLASGGKQ